ncbi:MAG: hypothetical protein V5B40_05625 [Candidatus Accumulibacter meliphilus]|uniref:hypothetical protein n=1 Tax=Candidatus Accumulibacter meliphilus TaxID=2211374 RepID=UPI002FC2EACE
MISRQSSTLCGARRWSSAQGFFAQRVRFDAGIFHFWASRWHHPLAAAADLAAFDACSRASPSDNQGG